MKMDRCKLEQAIKTILNLDADHYAAVYEYMDIAQRARWACEKVFIDMMQEDENTQLVRKFLTALATEGFVDFNDGAKHI